jgi:opacity protein-like surface antigen
LNMATKYALLNVQLNADVLDPSLAVDRRQALEKKAKRGVGKPASSFAAASSSAPAAAAASAASAAAAAPAASSSAPAAPAASSSAAVGADAVNSDSEDSDSESKSDRSSISCCSSVCSELDLFDDEDYHEVEAHVVPDELEEVESLGFGSDKSDVSDGED